jgi:hypothetical protein
MRFNYLAAVGQGGRSRHQLATEPEAQAEQQKKKLIMKLRIIWLHIHCDNVIIILANLLHIILEKNFLQF